MRKYVIFCMVSLLLLSFCESTEASNKKKKKKKGQVEAVQNKPTAKPVSKYDKLFNKKGHVATKNGFMTLHTVDGKLYFELPVKYMDREMLLASASSESSNSWFCTNGYKENAPMHIRFTLEDSLVYMRKVNASVICQMSEAREDLIRKQNFIEPILESYKVEAYNKDSSAVVFNMTALFTGSDPDLSPVTKGMGAFSVKASPKKDGTRLDEVKAFEDNVVIKTWYAYSVSLNYMGMIPILNNEPLTVKATRSLLLLPEEKMRPRYSDSRLGIFLTGKQLITNEEDQLRTYTLANRWRLEPKDPEAYQRGELVEPVKPIVWYVDDAFPELWRAPIKEGVLRWNKAFEKIGFKNVVQVKDFPKDDPTFDPDNLKYSCIRYIPTATANAMGPSWVDPTTGEIVNASVIVYNDLIKLINQWRFTQTAQVDLRVRAKKMPDDVVIESIAYAIAHEIGHTLGLMHNMASSNAYPVDSLRSAHFTQVYGTTPSIMDYARYNYVAQPTDKGVKLTPPDLGVYDEYAIKWLYSYFPKAKDADEEAVVLESWVDEKAGDPIYRYGKQQIAARIDPSAIEEDLGNDPMKASDYGIKNLKYIVSHMNEWIKDDSDASHRKMLYGSIVNQYGRYLQNVLYNVGGIYLSEVKDGTPGKRFESVPKEVQRASLNWALKQIKSCDWLDNKDLTDKFGLDLEMSARLRGIGSQLLMATSKSVLLSAHVAKDPYTVKAYFDDLYNGVWESAIQNRKATASDRALQTAMVVSITELLAPREKSKGLFGLTEEDRMLPSVEEVYAYGLDESGFVNLYIDELRNIEAKEGKGAIAKSLGLDKFSAGYGWQRPVKTDLIDETATYYCAMALKLKGLLTKGMLTAPDQETRNHYQVMLFNLAKLAKDIK